ncbi:unnamed protein product [Protopolystoma xenopodis]|uniref:Uncharacterized protein n=1 Tax=Protopolystoma xenopodis TaxID=117903 RepID=A0A3S5BRK7_9PLAT|nr:unnamed protein product [Protopolystoma xenopodis]
MILSLLNRTSHMRKHAEAQVNNQAVYERSSLPVRFVRVENVPDLELANETLQPRLEPARSSAEGENSSGLGSARSKARDVELQGQ